MQLQSPPPTNPESHAHERSRSHRCVLARRRRAAVGAARRQRARGDDGCARRRGRAGAGVDAHGARDRGSAHSGWTSRRCRSRIRARSTGARSTPASTRPAHRAATWTSSATAPCRARSGAWFPRRSREAATCGEARRHLDAVIARLHDPLRSGGAASPRAQVRWGAVRRRILVAHCCDGQGRAGFGRSRRARWT